MNKKEDVSELLNIITGAGIIIASFIGIIYSNGGARFTTINVYGNTIEMYGNGIYAFNSILTVANRLGADAAGIIAAVTLIVITLCKKRETWIKVIQASIMIYLAYHSACLVFGISMNSLYILYVISFGLSLFLSFTYIENLLKNMDIPESLKKKRLTGTAVFLILAGAITALLWISMIIPATLNNSYGSLLGVQTAEVSYGIDLSITCPIFIMCGIWLLKKKEIGYKVAPLLLNMMIGIAVLVISQKIFCARLGINISVGALIGFIISFVIMGIISLYLCIRLLIKLVV